jgi:cytoskeletal protein CcmA (bactofilin family)
MFRAHRTLAAAAVLVGVWLLAAPAWAQGSADLNQDDQIVLTGRLTIGSDETVDTASIFNGPATIDGTVREDLFVLNGDTEISGTVNGDVVVINGDVTVRSGAEIGGDLVTQMTPTVEDGATVRGDRRSVSTEFDAEAIGFAGRFAWWLGYTVSVLILGLLILAFAPRLDGSLVAAIRDRLGASIGLGAAAFFLLPIAAVVLLVTVVGIPLGIFVLLALALIYTVGYTATIIGVGGRLLSTQSRFVAFLVAWLIFRGVALIPFVGGLVWLLASAWGLGLLVVAARRSRVDAPPVAPPPPMPVPA